MTPLYESLYVSMTSCYVRRGRLGGQGGATPRPVRRARVLLRHQQPDDAAGPGGRPLLRRRPSRQVQGELVHSLL